MAVALGDVGGEAFPFRYAILDRDPVCESTDFIRLPDSPPSFNVVFIVIVVLTRGNDSVNRLLPPDGDKPTPASQCATLVCAYDRTALCFAAFGHITSQERRCRLTLGHARCERKVYAALVVGAQWRKA